jgi:hypothetical protein
MKNLSTVLGAASVLFLCAVAQAQDPAMAPAAPPATPGADVTVTTQTTTDYGDAGADTIVGDVPVTMPATGGAPIALALVGSLTAAGAFIARRKWA